MKNRRKQNGHKPRPTNYAYFIECTVKWLDAHLCESGHFQTGLLLVRKYLVILKTRGRREAIKFCKRSRLQIFTWLSQSDLRNGVTSTLRSLPPILRVALKNVKTLSDHPIIRLCLSALYASRGLTLPVEVNVDSITASPKQSVQPCYEKYIRDFWCELGVRQSHCGKVPKRARFVDFHLSTKVGPNGQALWSCLDDFYALPESLLDSLAVVGGEKINGVLTAWFILGPLTFWRKFFHQFGKERVTGRFRKVSAIQSEEGKTREIAILDYWSQTVLRPLHQYLFTLLKKIPQDCTFNQGSFLDKLPARATGNFYSVDLTAATDRFPMDLICAVMRGRFGERYVRHWRNIMVGYPFWTKEHGEIRYATGNPMGAYSSWNSFAISHHYVVYYCCRELGLEWSKVPYVMLGDDIVIANDDVAKLYISVLTDLGVEVSPSKTHVSPIMYEFAKRLIYDGVELTPFPISALWSTRRNLPLLLNVLDSEKGKGWNYPMGIPSLLSQFFTLLSLPRRLVKKREESLFVAFHILEGLKGRATAYWALKPIMVRLFPVLSWQLNKGCAESLFRSAIMITLRNSFLGVTDRHKALGPLAQRLTGLLLEWRHHHPDEIRALNDDKDLVDHATLLSMFPFLCVFRQIQEKFMDQRGEAGSFEDLMYGDWKTALRAVQLPKSDEVFYTRNQDLMILASFTFAKALLPLLRRANDSDLGLSPYDQSDTTYPYPGMGIDLTATADGVVDSEGQVLREDDLVDPYSRVMTGTLLDMSKLFPPSE